MTSPFRTPFLFARDPAAGELATVAGHFSAVPAAADPESFWRSSCGTQLGVCGSSHLINVALLVDLHAIFADNALFGNGDAGWRYLPTADEAEDTRVAHVDLLRRSRRLRKIPLAAEDWVELKSAHLQLADDLDRCRPDDRCGSMACLPCRRAWVRSHRARTESFFCTSPGHPTWPQHHLTVIPFGLQFVEGTLDRFDPIAATFRLKQVLDAVDIRWIAVGVLELSYEEVVGGWSYWQPHWHLLATGPDVPAIVEQLRAELPFFSRRNPSVVEREVYDLRGATQYDSKPSEKGYRWVAEAHDRAKRRVIPDTRQRELLLWLHRWSPWSMLVFVHAELTSSARGIKLRSTLSKEANVFS